MNMGQTVDPYKVWNRFPSPTIRKDTERYGKIRREVIELIAGCDGIASKELRAKTGHKKRAMFSLLQALQRDGRIERRAQRYYSC